VKVGACALGVREALERLSKAGGATWGVGAASLSLSKGFGGAGHRRWKVMKTGEPPERQWRRWGHVSGAWAIGEADVGRGEVMEAGGSVVGVREPSERLSKAGGDAWGWV
jgi:hypothetical protein